MLKRSRYFLEILVGQLFLLMGRVQTLARLSHAEAFDGLRQNHRGRAHMGDRGCIGCIHFFRIMAAAIEVPNLLIRHVGDHFLEFRVLAKEMLARVGAALGFEVLILAVHALFHDALQETFLVARQQRVPSPAPQNFDDVPARAQESRFEFLNDLAIAAHRPVEPLQIAIDDENEIVEFFAHRHGERPHRLGFIHFPIAQKSPDLAIGGRDNAAMLQVAQKSRLKNRHHRAQSHRHGGKLPKIRHQPWMRIGR